MKARSVIFSHVQWPFTIFGLPPKLVGLAATAAIIVYVVTFIIGFFFLSGAMALPLILFAATLLGGVVLSYRLGKTDRHIESVFLTTTAFWGLSPARWLLAGALPKRSPKDGQR